MYLYNINIINIPSLYILIYITIFIYNDYYRLSIRLYLYIVHCTPHVRVFKYYMKLYMYYKKISFKWRGVEVWRRSDCIHMYTYIYIYIYNIYNISYYV